METLIKEFVEKYYPNTPYTYKIEDDSNVLVYLELPINKIEISFTV